MPKIIVLLILCAFNAGCYYMQAASGQWQVMRKREPIAEVIADPASPAELVSRLQLLSEARDYSIDELGLPDNKSYRSYADLKRDFVVWNVLAAPEFSLAPKQWCFPVAGCVNYRGYFSKDAAIKAAKRLANNGFDVAVGGVAAYSTLGNFSDPILNTMLHWDDRDLVALLFHELAHQVVYVKDDSAFNESFATAVEEIGLQRWLEVHGRPGDYGDYQAERDRQDEVSEIIELARQDLKSIYANDADDIRKRQLKKARLERLTRDLKAVARRGGESSSAWLDGELNNAHLITSGLYEGLVPQFRTLYSACGESLQRFYRAAEHLATMHRDERDKTLAAGDLRCFASRTDR